MLRRTAKSGEGMKQDRSHGQDISHAVRMRAVVLRVAFGAACAGLATGLAISAAHAQTYGSDNGTAWSGLLKSFGLNKGSDVDIGLNYTERSPLVVPPNRELPPPVAAAPPVPDWPKDPAGKYKKLPKPKLTTTAPVVPAPDGTVGAVPAAPPVPQAQPKSWYNPISWFNKEEYATFGGEPVRDRLTDPPIGYRTPSPEQPYGVGPDKTKKAATASDLMLSPAGGQSSGH